MNRGVEDVGENDHVQIAQDTYTRLHVQGSEEGSESEAEAEAEAERDGITPRRNPRRQSRKVEGYAKKSYAHFELSIYEAAELLRTDKEFPRLLDIHGIHFGISHAVKSLEASSYLSINYSIKYIHPYVFAAKL